MKKTSVKRWTIGIVLVCALFAMASVVTLMQQDSISQAASKISLAKAKKIACNDAGVKTSKVTFKEAKLERENRKLIYDIEFYTKTTEYDYEIDAKTGKILEADRDIEGFNIKKKGKVITQKKAKQIALKDAGVKSSKVTFKKVKLENEDRTKIYDIEFYTKNKEYDYEIDAYSGKILESDYDIEDFDLDDKKGSYIGKNKAKNIALKHAKLKESAVDYIKVKLDKDDGMVVYEVEFTAKGYEYSYEINAKSGKILEWDKEYDD